MEVFETRLEWPRFGCALGLSVLISLYGWKKRSLNVSGAVAAVVVGFLLTAASACFCVSLLAFFFTSSRLTKWRSREKTKLEEDFKEGGQRDWIQVLCNGGVATVAALLYVHDAGYGERALNLVPRLCDPSASTIAALACLSSLACCCGDTWASEVGSVIGGTPRLITNWRVVPKGTNGGVTLIGTLCSIAGGLTVGIAYWITESIFIQLSFLSNTTLTSHISPWSQYPYAIVGASAGLFGSLVDSVLGATLQFSGYSDKLDKIVATPGDGVRHISGFNVISNHTVNFLSSLITALAIPVLWHGIVVNYLAPAC